MNKLAGVAILAVLCVPQMSFAQDDANPVIPFVNMVGGLGRVLI